MTKIVYDPRLEGADGMCWVVMDKATELGRFFNMARAAHAFPAALIDKSSFADFVEATVQLAAVKGFA
jgi:hypothetical protein